MKIDEQFFEKFASDMEAMELHYHRPKVEAIIKYLGPALNNRDSSLVACSDYNERHYIKEHFLVGKLGLDNSDPKLDQTIEQVCQLMGESNSHKNRVTFYYLLMAILEVEYTALN